MKKTWKGINELITSKSSHNYINQLNIKEKMVNEPVQIANAFNDFFVNVGPNTDK